MKWNGMEWNGMEWNNTTMWVVLFTEWWNGA